MHHWAGERLVRIFDWLSNQFPACNLNIGPARVDFLPPLGKCNVWGGRPMSDAQFPRCPRPSPILVPSCAALSSKDETSERRVIAASVAIKNCSQRTQRVLWLSRLGRHCGVPLPASLGSFQSIPPACVPLGRFFAECALPCWLVEVLSFIQPQWLSCSHVE